MSGTSVCVSCCAPRVGDRLVMEQLMVEVLEELTARELLPQEAAAVMQLAGGGRRRVAAADLADRGQQTMQDRGRIGALRQHFAAASQSCREPKNGCPGQAHVITAVSWGVSFSLLHVVCCRGMQVTFQVLVTWFTGVRPSSCSSRSARPQRLPSWHWHGSRTTRRCR